MIILLLLICFWDIAHLQQMIYYLKILEIAIFCNDYNVFIKILARSLAWFYDLPVDQDINDLTSQSQYYERSYRFGTIILNFGRQNFKNMIKNVWFLCIKLIKLQFISMIFEMKMNSIIIIFSPTDSFRLDDCISLLNNHYWFDLIIFIIFFYYFDSFERNPNRVIKKSLINRKIQISSLCLRSIIGNLHHNNQSINSQSRSLQAKARAE